MSITLEKLDEIERGCEGVTPGPWTYGARWICQKVTETDYIRLAEVPPKDYDSPRWNKDAAHIARLDPDTVRELVSLARSALSRSGEAVAPYVVLDEEGTALVPDDQAAAIKAAFEAVKPLAPFGKPLRRALKFYLADPPSSVPTGYKIVPEAAINALIERFAQIECQGITGQSIVTPQDLIDWTKGIAAAGYNEARAMLAASPTPKGGE